MESDPVTLGEVSRNVTALRQEVKEALLGVNTRLDRVVDRVVSSDIYASDKATFDYKLQDQGKEINELRAAIAKKEEQRGSDRRLIATAIVVPLFFMMINMAFTYFMFIKGGG